jgi:glucose-1-phosphate cytidylyltransferase
MKAVILAGGLGTRIMEESISKPKPMIEIGGKPILWHIMKIYSNYGINEFIVCCGFKGYLIKEFFANYFLHMSDVTFDMQKNSMTVHHQTAEPWKVTLIDTGEHTMTGGRLKRIASYVEGEECFCFTYGDGVADVNIVKLIEFHRSHGGSATLTATYPPAKFGAIAIQNGRVLSFKEKPKGDGGMINGGFFVLSPKIFSLLEGDEAVWEKEPLETLSSDGNLFAFEHHGFWHPMDTLRDRQYLESLWSSNRAPWKVWQEND